MKKEYLLFCSTIGLLATLIMAGCAGGPPTRWEQRYFNIVTNQFTEIVVQTNVIPVTVVKTNVLQITNLLGVTQFTTNIIPVFEYRTNVATVTNITEAYQYTPGAGAQSIKEVGGAIGNLFGVGGIVTTALGGLFGLWAQMRSSRRYRTAGSLAQTIETLRTFVKTLPNGVAYDQAFVNWMQSKQAEAGVLTDVVALLEREVSNPDAKQAVHNVQNLITALQNQT